MDKLDKLLDEMGIALGPWEITGSDSHLVSSNGPGVESIIGEFWTHCGIGNKGLVLQSRELLKALIRTEREAFHANLGEDARNIATIETATPPGWTWERIVKRLEEMEAYES